MSTSEGGSPQGDPFCINRFVASDEIDSRPNILKLASGLDELSGIAFTQPEMAVIEGQDRQSGCGEVAGEVWKDPIHGARKAVGENHASARLPALREVELAGDPRPAGGECHPRCAIPHTHKSSPWRMSLCHFRCDQGLL